MRQVKKPLKKIAATNMVNHSFFFFFGFTYLQEKYLTVFIYYLLAIRTASQGRDQSASVPTQESVSAAVRSPNKPWMSIILVLWL
jgi:di/tricarboxylate transporter